MSRLYRLDRRDFLRAAGFGAAGLYANTAALASPFRSYRSPSGVSTPDLELSLTAAPGRVRIFPGRPTRVWSYRGEVHKGDPDRLLTIPNSYLGPILRLRKGERVRVHFKNELPEATNVHWHGLRVPSEMDGHPGDLVAHSGTFTYEFQVLNRAGTYWYHPHPHMATAKQVYRGLAGLFVVSDDEEAAAGLPSGEYDLPLVIQDRIVRHNQLHYPMDEESMMMGVLGNRILVNGQPDYHLNVSTRGYRLRLLNGSNFRIYKLGWSDGTPMTVLGTDGGLLAAPVEREYVTLAPGERAEVWIDFAGRRPGSLLKLRSLAFEGVHGGEGWHHHGAEVDASRRPLGHGAPFTVMSFRVTRRSSGPALPATLSTIQRYRPEDAANGDSPRTFGLTFRNMEWGFNGRTFEMEEVEDDETVQLDTLEAWQFVNELNPGEQMETMGMAHPIHLHGVQFQVIDRQVLPELEMGWESVRHGYVDEGWKDTVLLMPGERVKLLMSFQDHAGRFVYHCHNLEHEDMGMMRNYLIRE